MYTTLNKILEHNLNCNGWNKLLQHLDKTGPDDEPLSLLTILESNGLKDAVWALRAVDDPVCERDACIFAVRCMRQVQHLFLDPRSLYALDVAERYATGMATAHELQVARDAAWDAVTAATTWDSAWDATAVVEAVDAFERGVLSDGAAAWAAAEATGDVIEVDFRAIFCAEDSPGPA